MNVEKIKRYLYHAVRTFIMAFLGTVVAMIPTVNWSDSKEMLKTTFFSIIASSVAAGLGAVMNVKEEDKGA